MDIALRNMNEFIALRNMNEFLDYSQRLAITVALTSGIVDFMEKGNTNDALTLMYHLLDYVTAFQNDFEDSELANARYTPDDSEDSEDDIEE